MFFVLPLMRHKVYHRGSWRKHGSSRKNKTSVYYKWIFYSFLFSLHHLAFALMKKFYSLSLPDLHYLGDATLKGFCDEAARELVKSQVDFNSLLTCWPGKWSTNVALKPVKLGIELLERMRLNSILREFLVSMFWCYYQYFLVPVRSTRIYEIRRLLTSD